ncbi:DUF2339 domain-containing protein [Candidatus Gracilibacteria bacterium]|nr:DUF2339 domain-containing protein [Candidatus Gracilibacteria bacterium]
MFQLLNRLTWVVSICLGLVIAFIDDDLIFFGIIIAIAIKFILFSPNYIKSRLQFFKTQILKSEGVNISQEVHQNTQDDFIEEISTEEDTILETKPMRDNLEEVNYIASQDQEHTPSEPREPNFIEKIFSENILAKVGGIIVFLGVLFLLSTIYAVIGPVGKIVIGFALGFAFYAAGVWLDKKGFINESRIVMGVAILINYLVILSGRFLLGSDTSVDNTLLSVGATFMFLILNTVFAVVTALLYNSRPLLIFGFVFAYLNPLLLGESGSEPYTLLGYTMIVTFGALFMSYKRKDEILFPLAFILASIMLLIAPWSDGSGWIAKLLCINTLGAVSLYCSTVFRKTFQNISEILIVGTFFLIGIMGFLGIENLSQLQMVIMGASSLGLMAFCYISSNRGVYLYSIGSLGTILTLSPALYANGLSEGVVGISALIVIIFGCMNIGIVITKSKDLLANNLGNILSGLISGAIFLTYMIYFFGNEFFPGMLQGFAFFGLAIIYCSFAFLVVNKIGIEIIKTDERYENTFYAISAIGVSLFSLAVAFVFSENKEIISIIWLLEANILFFLAQKTKSLKIAVAGLVLFIIGIIKFADYIDPNIFGGTSFTGDYGMLVALLIVLASLIYNLVILFNKNTSFLQTEFFGLHNLFHLAGIILIVVTGHEILDISGNWNSLLYFSVAVAALGVLYDRIESKGLKTVHLVSYLGLMAIHIIGFADDIGRDRLNLTISTIIAIIYALPFIYDYIAKGKIQNKTLFVVFIGYLFILSTLYIHHIFAVTFAVTFYWGMLSFGLLAHGIKHNTVQFRTLGLYLLTLMVLKIFLYDIWQSEVADGVGFIVFMITGILMIVLSTMYTKKFGNTLGKDFSLANLFPEGEGNNTVESPSDPLENNEKNTPKSQIQTDIESIDIKGINSVKLHFNGEEKPVTVRAENLIKISKLIANTYKKTEFKPGELKQAYTMIENEYKSALSPTQHKKLKTLVAQFVEKGGSIEFIK